jgi:hypothetical protein
LASIRKIDPFRQHTDPFLDMRERMLKRDMHYLEHIQRHDHPEPFDQTKQQQLTTCALYEDQLTSANNRLRTPSHADDTEEVRIMKLALQPLTNGGYLEDSSGDYFWDDADKWFRVLTTLPLVCLTCHDTFPYQMWMVEMLTRQTEDLVNFAISKLNIGKGQVHSTNS